LSYNGDNPFFMAQKHALNKLIIGGFALVALVGCSAPKNSNYSYVSGTGLAKKGRSSLTYHDFAFQSRGGGSDTLLSQGEEKILLLPIQFSDFPFNATTLQDINTTFNGAAEIPIIGNRFLLSMTPPALELLNSRSRWPRFMSRAIR
jgi:hypothetical protein